MSSDGATETGSERERLAALYRHHHDHEPADSVEGPSIDFYVDGNRLDLQFAGGTYVYRTDAIEGQARFVEFCKWQDALTLSADEEGVVRARDPEWSPKSALQHTAAILYTVFERGLPDLSHAVEVSCPDHGTVAWDEVDGNVGES
ncbi:hypothetical protein [Halomicrococcus gelatinilyticus]|uniref:hypothetical protein n=1 Tax=Halomicrococcus gelatinilyticus TaxID=1702103 RepID=UPI002E0F3850